MSTLNLEQAAKDQAAKTPVAPNPMQQMQVNAFLALSVALDRECRNDPNVMLSVLANLSGRILALSGVDPDVRPHTAPMSWFDFVRAAIKSNGGGGLIVPATSVPRFGGKR